MINAVNYIYFTWKREKYLLHGNAGDRSLMRPPCECVFSCRKDENQHGKKGEWEEQGDVPQAICNTATHLWPSTVRLFHRRGLSLCNKSVIGQKTATVWWWSTKCNCPLFILYNVLIMLTLIMAMLMTKWWSSPNAKASPSSLQATADTGESRSSASRDTWSLLLILMFWSFEAGQYWLTQYIMTKIISNTMVTLTLSGAWWPWICQRKACLKEKTLNDLEDNNFNNFNNSKASFENTTCQNFQ